jgi:hypothetical protein
MRRAGALLRYVLSWAIGGALVVAAVLVLAGRGNDDAVTLPPVRQIQLTAAARTAGCELRTGDRSNVLGLPVPGVPGRRPARAGVYDDPPDGADLVAALRRGVIVIQHRADLPDDVIDELRALQKAIPRGPSSRPSRSGPGSRWRWWPGAASWAAGPTPGARWTPSGLFRGRFIGSGPTAPDEGARGRRWASAPHRHRGAPRAPWWDTRRLPGGSPQIRRRPRWKPP